MDYRGIFLTHYRKNQCQERIFDYHTDEGFATMTAVVEAQIAADEGTPNDLAAATAGKSMTKKELLKALSDIDAVYDRRWNTTQKPCG